MKLQPRTAHKVITAAGCLAALIICTTLAYELGVRNEAHYFKNLTTVSVNADQIAQAMQDDRFFADYGAHRLLVQGTVTGVSQTHSGFILEFGTAVPTKVLCDLDYQPPSVHVGDTATVTALAADAQRASRAVRLKSCSLSPQE